jgi:hypothetical protein
MVTKKIYALALTPMLFIACANTEPKQAEVVQEKVVKSVVVEEVKEAVNVPVAVVTQTSIKPVAQEAQASVVFIENKKILEDGMMHIDAFMGSMQPTLKGLIKSDRTHVTAMGACTSMAPEMIDDYNRQIHGTKLRRTALKYRNPKNKPDKADRMVMDEFVNKQSFKPIVIELDREYRVYKPLKVKQACLLCHGARNEISPELVKMIDRTYPKDMATGFQLGEFRGAVVAEIQK